MKMGKEILGMKGEESVNYYLRQLTKQFEVVAHINEKS